MIKTFLFRISGLNQSKTAPSTSNTQLKCHTLLVQLLSLSGKWIDLALAIQNVNIHSALLSDTVDYNILG